MSITKPHNAVGLDFGTSNSAISLARKGSVNLVDIDGHKTMPTSVFIDLEGSKAGQISFGNHALNKAYGLSMDKDGQVFQGDRNLGKILRGLKSLLGTDTVEQQLRLRDDSGYHHCFMLTEFIEKILSKLKTEAEELAGAEIDSVVMGRPVHFVDYNEEQDKTAEQQLISMAQNVGFKNVETLFEPIAAALAYESTLTQEKLALVLDVGGGTTDVTVIRLSPSKHTTFSRESDILASTGVHIGGMDFDAAITMQKVVQHFGYNVTLNHEFIPREFYSNLANWPLLSRLYNKRTIVTLEKLLDKLHNEIQITEVERFLHIVEMEEAHLLLGAVEDAKIDLNDKESTNIDFSNCLNSSLLPMISMTASELNQDILAEKYTLIKRAITDALKESSVQPNQIEVVFMTGGPSAMPAIKSIVQGILPQVDIVEGDRLGAVGFGLGVAAHNTFLK